MALAGLWENWRSPAGEWIRSFAIVTCPTNTLFAEPHNRMPVVLGPETWRAWLGEEPADAGQLRPFLHPIGGSRPVLGGCAQVATEQGQTALRPPVHATTRE